MASRKLLNIRGNDYDGYFAEILNEYGEIVFTSVGGFETPEIAKEQTIKTIKSIQNVLLDSNNSIESLFEESK